MGFSQPGSGQILKAETKTEASSRNVGAQINRIRRRGTMTSDYSRPGVDRK